MGVSVLVRSEEQLKVVQTYPVEMIYTDNLELAEKYDLFYQVPRVADVRNLPRNILVGDVGVLHEFHQSHNIVIDTFLNVTNHHAIDVLLNYGVIKVNLALEGTIQTAKKIMMEKDYPLEVLVYGRVEDMLIKSHPLIQKEGYELKDSQGRFYPIHVDSMGHVHLFHHEPLNKIKEIPDYQAIGVHYFRVDFYDENEGKIRNIMDEVFQTCQEFTK